MMDGFVAEIREGLDQAGYQNIPIMSYGIKYASSFSVHSEMLQIQHLLGDRKTYQMDPANRLEALREWKVILKKVAI